MKNKNLKKVKNDKWVEMDQVEMEERNVVSTPACALRSTVAACLSPFVSHQDHVETFSWLKADLRMLSRAHNISYLFSRSVRIKI